MMVFRQTILLQVRQLREAHERAAIRAAEEQISKTHIKETVEKDAKRMQTKEEALRAHREVNEQPSCHIQCY